MKKFSTITWETKFHMKTFSTSILKEISFENIFNNRTLNTILIAHTRTTFNSSPTNTRFVSHKFID